MRDKETMRKRRALFLLAAAVSFATFAVYLRSLQNDLLAWDDNSYVIDNVHIRSLNASFFRWAFFDFYAANWHPLTWISHALDYAVWGLNPLGHHLTNVVLHGVNTFLVVLLVQGLLDAWRERSSAAGTPSFLDGQGSLIAAGATGVLFGLHPVHVESVAWVAERKDLLCGLFFLLSVMSYLRFAGTAGESGAEGWAARFRRRGYLSSLGLFILALMSKPMAVSLPLVLLLLDWHPLRRISSRPAFRSALIEKLPFIVLTLASAIVTVLAQEAGGALVPVESFPLSTRLLVAFRSLMRYLYNMIAPFELTPYYAYPHTASVLHAEYLVSILMVAGITAGCIVLARKRPFWLTAWAYYVITLIPVLGIIQVGNQPMADRYLYLPGLGPFVAAGLAAAGAWKGAASLKRAAVAGRNAVAASALLACIAMSFLTVQQIDVWKDSMGLWNYVIGRDPDVGAIPYNNRGELNYQLGRYDRALEDISMAVELSPSDPTFYNNRGLVLERLGRADDAIADYDAAIELLPSYAAAYYNRGILQFRKGRADRSLEDFDKAIALDPMDAKSYNNRAIVLDSMGHPDRAIEDLSRAVGIDPGHVSSYLNRGNAYLRTGRKELAARDLETACGLGSETGCEGLRALRQGQAPEKTR